MAAAPAQALAPAPAPAPIRSTAGSTHLAEQFRQSVQAGGGASPAAVPALPEEDVPQDGWFVGVNGVPLGPIPIGDLRELGVAGHIDRRSLVWREGQPEWKPLSKFPYLAKLLGDAAAPAPAPAVPPLDLNPAPAAPAMNGAAAAPAVSFAPARTSAEVDRPSGWGDLDDEDDSEVDEQPTTVKGRVSVAPPSPAPAGAPAAPGLPLAAPPPSASLSNPMGLAPIGGAPQSPAIPPAPNPMRTTGTQPLAPPGLGLAPGAALEGPASTISATPEPMLEAGDASLLPSSRGRGKLYRWSAVVAAFVLGVILTHVLGGSDDRQPVAAAPAPPPPAETKPPPAPIAAEPAPPPPEAAEAPIAEVPAAPVTRPAMGKLSVTTPAEIPPPPKPNSLLDGLSGPATPGPSTGARASAAGSGLDSTAIGKVVRRYTPSVRQNCWQRALNTRAPGTPTSAKVTAQIQVEPSGKVQSVTVAGAPRGYPGLAKCIEGAVKGWTFPRAAEGTTTNVPFVFVGQ